MEPEIFELLIGQRMVGMGAAKRGDAEEVGGELWLGRL